MIDGCNKMCILNNSMYYNYVTPLLQISCNNLVKLNPFRYNIHQKNYIYSSTIITSTPFPSNIPFQ